MVKYGQALINTTIQKRTPTETLKRWLVWSTHAWEILLTWVVIQPTINLPKLLYTTTLDTVCCICLGCIGMTPYTSVWGSFWTKKQCFSSTSPIPPELGGGQFALHSAGSSELPDSFILPKCSKISVMDFPTGYWNYIRSSRPTWPAGLSPKMGICLSACDHWGSECLWRCRRTFRIFYVRALGPENRWKTLPSISPVSCVTFSGLRVCKTMMCFLLSWVTWLPGNSWLYSSTTVVGRKRTRFMTWESKNIHFPTFHLTRPQDLGVGKGLLQFLCNFYG